METGWVYTWADGQGKSLQISAAQNAVVERAGDRPPCDCGRVSTAGRTVRPAGTPAENPPARRVQVSLLQGAGDNGDCQHRSRPAVEAGRDDSRGEPGRRVPGVQPEERQQGEKTCTPVEDGILVGGRMKSRRPGMGGPWGASLPEAGQKHPVGCDAAPPALAWPSAHRIEIACAGGCDRPTGKPTEGARLPAVVNSRL